MTKFYVTRQEISVCEVDAENRAEAIEIARQMPDDAFEREEECDSLWAEVAE